MEHPAIEASCDSGAQRRDRHWLVALSPGLLLGVGNLGVGQVA